MIAVKVLEVSTYFYLFLLFIICGIQFFASCVAISTVFSHYGLSYFKDSEFTNAGFGSNLTESGSIECDASVMDASLSPG